MTVIAWDGKTLAADKRTEERVLWRTTTKIRRTSNGYLLASAGDADIGRAVLAWFENGADPDLYPPQAKTENNAGEMLAIAPDGTVLLFQRTPYGIEIADSTIALGIGRDAAMAAMYLGCDAKKAVEVASAVCVGCGNGIDTLELK